MESAAELSSRARSALLTLLQIHYGIYVLPRIVTNAGGKPLFADFSDIHFSLSHCRAAVMATVCDSPVGCDIEDIVSPCDVEDLLAVAFNADERHCILASSAPSLELTRLWTRKEAIVKCRGIIPDEPRDWPSDAPQTVTSEASGYVFTYHWQLPG